MKVAFVGKGGSGKTTLSALFCLFIAQQQLPIIGIDADINQHLGTTLGLTEEEAASIPPAGQEIERLKAYVRGNNPRLTNIHTIIKTTPPGRGSRFFSVRNIHPPLDYFTREIHGIRLMVTGPFAQEDLGLKCYHSKVGAVELFLNHLLDQRGEYAVVDMTAGADSFASGLFTRFDATFLVVEPTLKSLSVYKQYQAYAQNYDIRLKVIGNKIEGKDDLSFLKEHVGDDLLTWLGRSAFVRALEKGQYAPIHDLEQENIQALTLIQQYVDACQKNWHTFYQQAIEFHRRNALSWANAQMGTDLTQQIDPDFSLEDYVDSQQMLHV